MTSVPCRVCGTSARVLFQLVVLGDTPVDYFTCDDCGYTQTQEPDWLHRAYEHPIAAADTGILSRNIRMAGIVGTFLAITRFGRGPHLDYAGGFGLFTRLMRDIGFDFYHRDPYTPNLLAVGFEWDDNATSPTVCTAFEVLEHFPDPIAGLSQIVESGAKLIVTSTQVIDEPPTQDWWYLAPETGQHVGFFQTRTLRRLAATVGVPHLLVGSQHQVWSKTPIPRVRWRLAATVGRLMLPVLRAVRPQLTESDSELLKSRIRATESHGDGD